jgi:hypothetical protein
MAAFLAAGRSLGPSILRETQCRRASLWLSGRLGVAHASVGAATSVSAISGGVDAVSQLFNASDIQVLDWTRGGRGQDGAAVCACDGQPECPRLWVRPVRASDRTRQRVLAYPLTQAPTRASTLLTGQLAVVGNPRQAGSS